MSDGSAGTSETGGAGLVICAITRESPSAGPLEGFWEAWPARFPSPEMVSAAAALLPRRLDAWAGEEGPRAFVEVGPGLVRVGRIDRAKWDRRLERVRDDRSRSIDLDVLAWHQPMVWATLPPEATTRGAIREFSKKSQARLVAAIVALDWTGFRPGPSALPAMVTLTYPGPWQEVVPDHRADKRHVDALRRRFEYDWGRPLRGVWKRETQRRGAPHRHILTMVPAGISERTGEAFADWLARSWVEIVDHPDPEHRRRHLEHGTDVSIAEGLRATDPRRVAAYFLKHSAGGIGKEYQNEPVAEWTESAGRFWGIWGMDTATEVVDVPTDDAIRTARICRRWARAQGTTREVRVPRITPTGTVRTRRVRRRVRRMGSSAGFIAVNDGPAFLSAIARALDLSPPPRQPTYPVTALI